MTACQFTLAERLIRGFSRSAATLVYDHDRPGLFQVPEKLYDQFTSTGAKIVKVAGTAPGTVNRVLDTFQTSHEVKDGDTPLDLILSASAGIYFPGNNPNIGDPDISINDHESENIVSAYRSNQVNGITLSSDFQESIIDATSLIVLTINNPILHM